MDRAIQAMASFPPPRWRRPLLALASVVFVLGGTYYAAQLSADWSDLGWHWLLLASVIGVPLTILANALEFRLSARLIGTDCPMAQAYRVAVVATAANLLPMPGGALVRVQALRQDGHGYGSATYTTAVLAVSWVSVATLMTGLLLLSGGYWTLGAGWSIGGVALLAVAFTLASKRLKAGTRAKFMLSVLAVEFLSVGAAGLRLYLALLALGEPASLSAAGLLAFAGVVAAAVGVFPGGLGLREMLAAWLVPVVGISAAAGFLATAVDRVLGLLVHAPLALYFSRTGTDRAAA